MSGKAQRYDEDLENAIAPRAVRTVLRGGPYERNSVAREQDNKGQE